MGYFKMVTLEEIFWCDKKVVFDLIKEQWNTTLFMLFIVASEALLSPVLRFEIKKIDSILISILCTLYVHCMYILGYCGAPLHLFLSQLQSYINNLTLIKKILSHVCIYFFLLIFFIISKLSERCKECHLFM